MFSKSMDEKRQDHGKDMHESAAEIQNEENGAQSVSASDHESNASTGGFLLNRLMTGLLNRTMGWRAASSDVSDSISENVNNETMYFDSLSNSDPNIDAIRLDEPQETNDNLDGREKLNHNLSKHNSEGEREMGPNLEEVPESEPEMLIMAGGEMVSTDAYSDTESSPLPSDYVEQFQRYGGMKEFALLVASTLASVPEGCEAKRMRALIANDWSIDAEMVANRFDFETFAQFLESEFMRAYVEEKAIVNDSVLYTVKVAPQIEHITQTVADEKLSKEQLALKRKYQRLLELRKPENQEAFIEGKRRILKILFDLNAFDEAVAYSRVQNEYMKKYEVCLNAEELSRLFRNKSALKNIRHAFYKEIDVIEQNPLIIKLKANVKLPDELSEEDKRQAVGIKDVEIPSFIDDSFQPATQQRVGFAAAQYSDIKKQTNMRRQVSF
ncbi:hypothetical protein Tcan_07046 [Toxocara canis]|uniref:Uncharacterized protein n=1 Tax=Toxocara canis TaxID=6265 RepID=A0A0B2UZI6_TOXCA|nr:hypothetical protein Tcan_07046 [Toxocara canis]